MSGSNTAAVGYFQHRGMTLLEVLVAMFILSVVSVAGLNLLASGTGNLQHRQQLMEAGLVAHNVLVDMRLQGNRSAVGEYQGSVAQGGGNYSWTMTVSRSLDQEFLQAEVQVYEEGDREYSLTSLVALVPES